jgi:hypothetical protein
MRYDCLFCGKIERYAFDKSARYWEGWGGDEYGDESLRRYWLHESFSKQIMMEMELLN